MIKNFNQLIDQIMLNHSAGMRPVVEKEVLHYEIFVAMQAGQMMDDLVFQGGTSLRLVRGANRYSEDLDFSGGLDYSSEQHEKLGGIIASHIHSKFGMDVSVKNKESGGNHVDINKWQISVQTRPERPDIAMQKIKIEIADVPNYSSELAPLKDNYSLGYQILVNVETIDEIMADKLIAFPAAKNIRYRDIWDLTWLSQQGAEFNQDYIENKINDYGINDFDSKVLDRISELNEIVFSKEFHQQMSRFIDPAVITKTLGAKGFKDHLVKEVTRMLKLTLNRNKDEPVFRL